MKPPWRYNARNNPDTRFSLGVHGHYPTMPIWTKYNKDGSVKELGIDSFDIQSMADTNCALCMWCTFPYLEEQIKLFKHWGFEYKTVLFNWVKTNKNNNEPFFGVGYYSKSNSEICLLGTKGKMKPVSNKVSSIIISPREEHSKKPDVARDRIVELFGDIPRIEMFARKQVEGWSNMGNETNKFN